MRYLTLKDDKLKSYLKEVKKIVDDIFVINEKLQKLDQERKVLGLKRQRILDKTRPLVEEKHVELGEFEQITQIKLEKGEPTLEIVDNLEEYKIFYKEQKAKKDAENK